MTYAIRIHAMYVRMLSMSHNQTCAMRGEAPTKLRSTSTLCTQYMKHNIAHIVTIEHLLIIYHMSHITTTEYRCNSVIYRSSVLGHII